MTSVSMHLITTKSQHKKYNLHLNCTTVLAFFLKRKNVFFRFSRFLFCSNITSIQTSLFKLYNNLTSSQLKYSRAPLTQSTPLTGTKSDFPWIVPQFISHLLSANLNQISLVLTSLLTQTNFYFPLSQIHPIIHDC